MAQTPASADLGGMGRATRPPQRVYATHVAFDVAPDRDARPAGGGDRRVRFNLRNRSRPLGPPRYEVTLELTVICEDARGAVWRAEVHQAGTFDLAGTDGSERARVLNTACVRALFPLAKAAADTLVQHGGFPPFELPPFDFDAVYRRYQDEHHAPGPLGALREFWRAVVHLQAQGGVNPGPRNFHALHGEALAVAQLSRDALAAADQVLATAPADKTTLDALAAAYSMNDAHRRTAKVYALAVAARPQDARARYNLAAALMFNGDLAGAEREIDESIRLQADFWDAYTVRSQVRRQSAQHNHVDGLAALLAKHAGEAQAVERLNMALGKEYEDLGDYAHAFTHFAAGNQIGKLRRRYDFARDARVFDALAEHAPRPQPASVGCASAEPIFVFGMPRSGTTLVDRILSSHPDVTSAGELKQFGMLLKYACNSPTEDLIDADTIDRSRELDWRALGAQYLANTRPVTGSAAHFVDKFPHHFLYAGYIANALPNAKLVCLRRNPLDTCLGNFRQVFSEGSPFHGYACDLADAGHYYVRFDRLMRQWQGAFPGRILEVHYEALVADQEGVTRQLLDFCGLPWNAACLAFEENRAPVATASAVQVRSRIYRDAVARWKHYAAELEPLLRLLAAEGIEVPPA
ncbi:MAG TPA: protein-export chaperone SecB [Rhodanobacteraceae bacterium]|nr:protein-export chaperone SecB [Rhodanobacteraceae bacterium]